jgi:1-deoxy-D-xylulose-5-phosphate synthase
MEDGTGLNRFAEVFPKRFFDVGISEEHAVGLAAGLARGGFTPVIAIYSTFLQRGYDQIIHDICLQDLPVVFAVDRAGLVGEDGPTHHGLFDIAYLRHIPNLTVMAPADPAELKKMLDFAVALKKPVAIRYPKGSAVPVATNGLPLVQGKGAVIREGKDVALFALGNMIGEALKVAELLSKKHISAAVVNARFVKPLDAELIERYALSAKRIVTLEEGVSDGGFGGAVLEFLERENLFDVAVRRIALPDRFIEHGKRSELFGKYNLTPENICDVIIKEVMEWRK